MVVGLCWALFVPPWQSPDENAQFAYAQSIAERGKLPGTAGRPGWSTDQLLADQAVGANQVAFRAKVVKPDWNAQDFETYKRDFARLHSSRSNGGGSNPARSNPPLYYVYADLAYWASYSGTTFDRLYAMRIWGILLLALAALGAWLLAGEVFGRRRLLQLVSAAVVGLFPMETFMATSVNPDGMQVTLWTFALWLGARVIRRGGRPRDVLWLAAVTAVAILTKSTSYALLPAVLVAVLIGFLRRPPSDALILGFAYSVAGLIVTVPVFLWIEYATSHGGVAFNSVATAPTSPGTAPIPFKINEFLAYLWQFYLPRLSFMGLNRTTPGLSVYNIWLRTGWADFGWFEILLPTWLYTVLGAVTAGIGVISAVIVGRFRGAIRWQLMLFFALAMLALLFGLHLTDYRSIIRQQGAVLQGRYLLPVLGLFGLAVALIVSRVPVRWRAPVCGVLLVALLGVQAIALATVAGGYYT